MLTWLLLGHAIQYRKVIETFVAVNKDLHKFKLTEEDWTTITLVSTWLKQFHSATIQMSATKTPMLSLTLAIFQGLQDSLHQTICTLPRTTPPKLKQGLVKVHLKLSTYYGKTDLSPYYVWACHMYIYLLSNCYSLHTITSPRSQDWICRPSSRLCWRFHCYMRAWDRQEEPQKPLSYSLLYCSLLPFNPSTIILTQRCSIISVWLTREIWLHHPLQDTSTCGACWWMGRISHS